MLTLLDKESAISQHRRCILLSAPSLSLNFFSPHHHPSPQHRYRIPWSAVGLQGHAFYLNGASAMCGDQGPGHHQVYALLGVQLRLRSSVVHVEDGRSWCAAEYRCTEVPLSGILERGSGGRKRRVQTYEKATAHQSIQPINQ
jgi:hypothetical protein